MAEVPTPPTPHEIAALVAWLRGGFRVAPHAYMNPHVHAAEALEALTAENATLREHIERRPNVQIESGTGEPTTCRVTTKTGYVLFDGIDRASAATLRAQVEAPTPLARLAAAGATEITLWQSSDGTWSADSQTRRIQGHGATPDEALTALADLHAPTGAEQATDG